MSTEAPDRARDVEDVRISVRTELHVFACAVCGNTCAVEYEVRDYLAPSGTRWVVHCREGMPVPAPHFGAACPRCGRISVMFDGKVHETQLHAATG